MCNEDCCVELLCFFYTLLIRIHESMIAYPNDLDSLRALHNLRSRIFTLALFASVTVLLYSDHSLIAPNLSAIAEDFDFSDKVRNPSSSLSTR